MKANPVVYDGHELWYKVSSTGMISAQAATKDVEVSGYIKYEAVEASKPTHADKRQVYGGLPSVEGMDARYQNPFVAFWNQGLVPGQGFPQVGMSAYGYGLPGLGLRRFLSPDALILAGAGEGEINGHDLNHMDDQVYGYDRFHHHNAGSSVSANSGRYAKLLAMSAVLGMLAA
ncbi:hypothetical protein H4S02_007442 [Coemansia sp. RSA 2611]|nr:hypothetical protein H4S02_007442 [Coemansia sp. RSA 2611]